MILTGRSQPRAPLKQDAVLVIKKAVSTEIVPAIIAPEVPVKHFEISGCIICLGEYIQVLPVINPPDGYYIPYHPALIIILHLLILTGFPDAVS